MRNHSLIALAAALAAVAQPAAAQDGLSAAEAAKSFGARPGILDASMSPDGTKIAIVVPGPGQSAFVEVLDLVKKTNTPVNKADGNPMTLTGCTWVTNARLICQLYGVSDTNYNRLLPYTRMVAMNADGSNPMPLSTLNRYDSYAQLSDGYVIDWRDGSDSKVLIARRYVASGGVGMTGTGTNAKEGLGVDLLDTETAKTVQVESPDTATYLYLADGKGNVRIKGADESIRSQNQSRGITTFSYRTAGSKQWKPFGTYNGVTEEGMYPVGVDGAADVAYVLKKLDGRDALYRVALDGTMKTELAFAHPKVDVSDVARTGREGRIVGARYTIDAGQIEFFDPKFKELMTYLSSTMKALPLVHLVDSSADGTKHLVYAGSDTDAGRYFVFDSTTKKMMPLGKSRPDLTGVPLGEMKSITYKAADGTEVPAYLTLPAGSAGKKLPAIVMPHGGPASRDTWGFDWMVQFFASRGYAVIQPNFRGSSGYGDSWFKDNGFKSWKLAIGDVNDAGRYLVAQGIADPEKLAIFGWSYGGYAALQANVVDPNLFKAVIAVAPVTDLGALKADTGSRIQKDYIGSGPHITEGSPARHPELFKAPVLMFHGDKDINVDLDQAKLMDRQLKKAGKSSELIVYPKLDHQLDDSAIRADLLAKSDAFLAKALKR
ncbi:alpha/beta hydrolase family protein [Sphingomonas soli]|uniref:alpha/beta hydrolase family protein n=1 Tax=Sphingomonas soli TaxID=266127 RepID=UPI000A573B88|nr:alpha/beta fold hydrolase [Sphingomonas soli]